jgi:beta-glucosidase
MHQQSFVTRRNRYLLAWAPFMVLGLVVAIASSCTRLENGETVPPGGTSGSSASGSAGVASGSGSGTVSSGGGGGSSGGGSTSTCVATAKSLVDNLSVLQLSTVMAGEPSGCAFNTPNLNDIFETPGLTTPPIKGFKFRDGPRGVCMAANLPDSDTGYSTVFPVGSLRGATFDTALEKQIGKDMGDEIVASGHSMILAPVINILRHPAWGRAQETYGEDSYHLGVMGSAYVEGAQQYVPACAKHFAANNVENGRQGDIAIMDEQTLYEIYGRHFEMVIQDGGVACIMASYNLVQSCQSVLTTPPTGCGLAANSTLNPELLTTMLRTTFGFTGFVLSDWWAMPGGLASCPGGQQAQSQEALYAQKGVTAGLDMELPWILNYTQLPTDVNNGSVTPALLKTAAENIVTQECRFNLLNGHGLQASPNTVDAKDDISDIGGTHNADARQAATEGMVLLKNANNTLPIPKTVKTLAVIGASVPFTLASAADIQTGTVSFLTNVITGNGRTTLLTGDLGSSRVYPDPAKSVGPLAGITAAAKAIGGINVVSGPDLATVMAASTTPPDFFVVIAGNTPEDAGEDYTGASDRLSFVLDDKIIHADNGNPIQDPLIEAVATAAAAGATPIPMAVVLEGGSVIDMPWLAQVPAVVMAWYAGQDMGDALADLLFGNKNFSGKLPVTWPNPSTGTCTRCPGTGMCPACFGDEPLFSGVGGKTVMDYYLGYRYYDHNNIKPFFPFGYGLSYTTYSYGALSAPATAGKTDTVMVTVPVKNMGTVAGDEVSFLFVSYPNTKRAASLRSSVKELKGFVRTPSIMPGQTAMVAIPLRVSDLKYWDSTANGGKGAWGYETGAINLMVGGSSDALTATGMLTITP